MRNYSRSAEIFRECRQYMAAGVGSSARLTPEMHPLVLEKGSGSKVFDVDGNAYIDYIMGWGPLILGYTPATVIEAVKRQLEFGTTFGSTSREDVTLSKMVCESIPSVELVRFTNSASEAVHIALRLARAYSGRNKIVKFEGSYHGWFDNILVSVNPGSQNIGLEESPQPILEQPGISRRVLDDILIVPWNRPDILDRVVRRHANEIGAVIAEPIMCNNGLIPPQEGFLEELREICRRHEIVLIFDETITGFRAALGGAQAYYGVTPDLTVFGKGMGGGYPIAGFGGIKEIMELVADGRVKHQGTYNSNSLCASAAIATLNELRKENGAVYGRMTALGKRLMEGIEGSFRENGLPITLQGPGTFFSTLFTDRPVHSYRDTFRLNASLYSKFWTALLDRGIRIWPSARSLWYLSSAHTEEDIESTIAAVRSTVEELK